MMTHGMVHDFGNMMQIVAGAIETIDGNLDRPHTLDLHAVAQRALAAIGRASLLTRNILRCSRHEPVTIQQVDVVDLMQMLARMLKWIVGPAIYLVLELPDAQPVVGCDPIELENAVLNLAINARDAMPCGGQLMIAVSNDAGVTLGDETPCVTIEVRDTGCGMSKDVIERVLEPYFTTKQGSGNGLGLWMVATFVARAGGSIALDSKPGLGTTVALRLPALRDGAASTIRQAPSTPA